MKSFFSICFACCNVKKNRFLVFNLIVSTTPCLWYMLFVVCISLFYFFWIILSLHIHIPCWIRSVSLCVLSVFGQVCYFCYCYCYWQNNTKPNLTSIYSLTQKASNRPDLSRLVDQLSQHSQFSAFPMGGLDAVLIYDSKLNIYEVWTKQEIWKHHI